MSMILEESPERSPDEYMISEEDTLLTNIQKEIVGELKGLAQNEFLEDGSPLAQGRNAYTTQNYTDRNLFSTHHELGSEDNDAYEHREKYDETDLDFITGSSRSISIDLNERIRMEKIRQIGAKLNHQLSVINEQSDQSISIIGSSPMRFTVITPIRITTNQNILGNIMSNENIQPDITQKKKKKKKKKVLLHALSMNTTTTDKAEIFIQPPSIPKKKPPKIKKSNKARIEIEIHKEIMPSKDLVVRLNIFQYLREPLIELEWKLLLCFLFLLTLFNVLLNSLELMHYAQSDCSLEGLNNIYIYINQAFYVLIKLGLFNIMFQEFTNTLATKGKIPFVNPSLLSSIFPILSMPLYVFDFVTCKSRCQYFTVDQAMLLIAFFDWAMISTILLVVFMKSCLKVRLSRERWKKLKKYFQFLLYLSLIVVHSIQFILIISQFNQYIQPAMFLENVFFTFSLIIMIYLSICKFCFGSVPFIMKNVLLPQVNYPDLTSELKIQLNKRVSTPENQTPHLPLTSNETKEYEIKQQFQFKEKEFEVHQRTEMEQSQSMIQSSIFIPFNHQSGSQQTQIEVKIVKLQESQEI